MRFVSYPKHEFACPHLTCCPHAGGAALGTLVYAADEQTDRTDALQRQVDALRAEVSGTKLASRCQAGRRLPCLLSRD